MIEKDQKGQNLSIFSINFDICDLLKENISKMTRIISKDHQIWSKKIEKASKIDGFWHHLFNLNLILTLKSESWLNRHLNLECLESESSTI